VNNPLFGMLTYARLIRKDVSKVALDEKTRARVEEQLAIIERESMRCGDLMKSLLQFSRQAPIQPSPCPINTVVQRACALIRHQMELAEIELKLHLDPDLGEIIADGGQIQQILIALLVNATEAIGQKGVITVTTRRHGAGVAIAVSDDGPGVDAALQAQIFEPFFTTKENHHRTGLGLAVAKDIVERHGGTIRLQSQAGQGAEFVVELPPAPLPGPGIPSFHRLESECPKASS
jgi:two-component system NtrC family sensor kinase